MFPLSRCSDPIPRGSFSCSALLTASPCHQNLSLPPSRKYLAARSPCSTFLPWIFSRENYLAARSCVLSSRCSDPIPRGSFSCSVLLTASPRHQNPFQLPWQLSLNSHLLPRSPRIRKQSSRLTTPPSSMIKALSGCGVKFSKIRRVLFLLHQPAENKTPCRTGLRRLPRSRACRSLSLLRARCAMLCRAPATPLALAPLLRRCIASVRPRAGRCFSTAAPAAGPLRHAGPGAADYPRPRPAASKAPALVLGCVCRLLSLLLACCALPGRAPPTTPPSSRCTKGTRPRAGLRLSTAVALAGSLHHAGQGSADYPGDMTPARGPPLSATGSQRSPGPSPHRAGVPAPPTAARARTTLPMGRPRWARTIHHVTSPPELLA